MAADLTKEASEGFDWQRQNSRDLAPHQNPGNAMRPENFCPYLNTSPSAMAWHLGRHLEQKEYQRPTTARGGWQVFASRGDTFRLALGQAAIRFRWNPDNTFTELP